MKQSPTSPLNAIVHEAGRRLQMLHLTQIHGGEADRADIANVVDDFDQICRIVDPMIEAIFNHVAQHLHGNIDRDLFRDQLRGALYGNAIFEIENAVADAEGSRADTIADQRRALWAAE